mmetsp:Transcript_17933/g.39785  ORF Transcript_17933/g.39785 Transcript_17933/m.39785 type:complete len:871 (-) Transcript_17933:1298-3910(-)
MCRSHFIEMQQDEGSSRVGVEGKGKEARGSNPDEESIEMFTPAKRKRSALENNYRPPEVKVGEKVMKYFTDAYYEGKLARLPTKSSPYYFIVYEDGDKEDISEDDFWAAYSDWRVNKGVIRPSEFVPNDKVVVNDGRLAVVRTFCPVSRRGHTTWSYRVHFTGWSSFYDKWMPEADLRRETSATLRWAEKVREANRKAKSKAEPRTPSKAKSERSTTNRSPETQSVSSSRINAVKRSVEETPPARPYPMRNARSTGSDSTPAPKRAKTAASHSTSRSSSSGWKSRTRRSVMEDRASKAKNKGRKRLTRGKAAKTNEDGDDGDEDNGERDVLPVIEIGTSVLKYFSEGRDYFEGEVTRLPSKGRGPQYYHIVYEDEDEEDMEANDLWVAFSDWCVANGEISLTKFEPDERVFASEGRSAGLEAVIHAFRPILKSGSEPDDWSWSYLVHFIGWNNRHDEWLDEELLRKVTPTTAAWAEQVRKGAQKQASSPRPSHSTNTSTPGTSRKREREAESPRKKRWRCHRCDQQNDPDHNKCSECLCWKGGKTPRKDLALTPSSKSSVKSSPSTPGPTTVCAVEGCNKYKQTHCDRMCRAHFRESQEGVESIKHDDGAPSRQECAVKGCNKYKRAYCDGMCNLHFREAQEQAEEPSQDDSSTSSDDSATEWSCQLCTKQNSPDIMRCSGCKGWRLCFVAGCTKRRQRNCDGMCAMHFKEAQEANESSDGSESEFELGTDTDAASGSRRCHERVEASGPKGNESAAADAKNSAGASTASASPKPLEEAKKDESNGSEVISIEANKSDVDDHADASAATGTATKSDDQTEASTGKKSTDTTGTIKVGEAPTLESVLNRLEDSDDEDDESNYCFGYFGMEL